MPRATSDDPRWAELLVRLAKDRALRPCVDDLRARRDRNEGRKFGSDALQIGGKLFAFCRRGALVVKLPKARVAELSSAGVGGPLAMGGTRIMKEWLELADHDERWDGLVREAFAFVRSEEADVPSSTAHRPRRGRAPSQMRR